MEPSIQVGNINGDGNAVGHGNSVHVEKASVAHGNSLADLVSLIGEMRTIVEKVEPESKLRRALEPDIAFVEDEVKSAAPDGVLIQSKLKSIAGMAENVAAVGAAGVALAPFAEKAIALAQSLFK